MGTSNELRLFISSTFRDMQEEREYLIKKIFPEIRALCRERGITFTEVDLRWGLTDEDVVLGQVVRTCLEEIDLCRPYFIGLVGDRYGWAPPLHEYYKDPHLFTRWPWLEEAAMEGSSITDIEFRHAALNDPALAEHARFYFRRKRRSLRREETTDDEENSTKLDELKQRVEQAGLSIEEYRDPASVGEMIYDELIDVIERDFADAAPPTPLEEERARHSAFAASRRRAYIPDADYLRRLETWLEDDDRPLVLYAESGSGKSSLVSFWCEQLRRRRPDLFIIEHYVGIGAGDSDHLGVIRHVMQEFRERFDRPEEFPSRPEKLESEFANWLGFGVGQQILLVLDGINQLSGRALELHWLPPVMPEGVKLIISSTVEGPLVDLRERNWSELGLQPLDKERREALVVRFLAEYRKALSPEHVRRIAADPKSAHPLYLRTLLEELRLYGRFEHLDRTLDTLLSTTGTEDLFQSVLQRLEDDFSQKSVREVLSLIWVSRDGLTEEDLEGITGISRLKLSSMILGLEYHLMRQEGRLNFFHDYLRRAVEKRYLANRSSRDERVRQMIDYFADARISLRSTTELLHGLELLNEQERLFDALSDIERFRSLWAAEEIEVLRFWSSAGGATVVDAYLTGLARWEESERSPEDLIEVLGYVAHLFSQVSAWSAAEPLERRRLELARTIGDRALEVGVLVTLSRLMNHLGHIADAEKLARESADIARANGLLPGVISAAGSLGNIHADRGEFAKALSCYAEQEQTAREIGDRHSIAYAIGNRGLVHAARREYAEAFACYREAEQISRELGNRLSVALSACNRGILHSTLGEFSDALSCYAEYERIARELGQTSSIGIALGNRGTVYHSLGQHGDALACIKEAARLHRDIGFLHGLTYWLNAIARSLLALVNERGEMPAFLPQYVQDADPGSWKMPALATARENVIEAIRISGELSKPDTLFDGRILLCSIEAAEGHDDRAIMVLEKMLEETAEDEERADIYYWLWKLGSDDDDHRFEDLRLYDKLSEKAPIEYYRNRIEDLEADEHP